LRKLLAGLLLGLGAALFVLAMSRAGLLDKAELTLYDWRVRLAADPASVNPDIVLVEINDLSISDLEKVAGRWPWPRVLQSNLIDFLKRGQARVIAYDVVLTEQSKGTFPFGDVVWSGEESDAALVESVRAADNVILLANAVNPGTTGAQDQNMARWPGPEYRLGPAIEERPLILPPFPALADAAAGLGHNFLAFDADGPARRMAPFIRSGDRYVPSLGIAAALKAGGLGPDEIVLEGDAIRVRDRRIPLVRTRVRTSFAGDATHDQLTTLINFRAPTALNNGDRPYKTYEARHLLYSEEQIAAGQKPIVDPAVFKNKIVFVGLNASGLLDVFGTPFGSDATMPGIQVHASMADNLLANRFIQLATPRSRIASVLLMALAVGLVTALLPFFAAALATAAMLGGWTWFAVHAFRDGQWVNLVQPLAAGAVALFMGTAYQYLVEGREKRRVKKLFGRFVPRDVYAQLIAHPELAELGGKRREMTVLFSDIRGFTSVTEKGNPEELVAQLNEYFSRMVEVVFRHKGTVDKFVGDMVMALFGAPLDDPDHAEHAVQAAIDMVKELGELNKAWAARGMAELDIGVGINSGDMIAGNIGSSAIMSYTVIGDNVNLGSRLESLNKDYKTRIIMSDATRTRLINPYDTRPLGEVTVKGKSKAVAIFEIKVPSPFVTPGSPAGLAVEEHSI
jgi:adenylate cyclase